MKSLEPIKRPLTIFSECLWSFLLHVMLICLELLLVQRTRRNRRPNGIRNLKKLYFSRACFLFMEGLIAGSELVRFLGCQKTHNTLHIRLRSTEGHTIATLSIRQKTPAAKQGIDYNLIIKPYMPTLVTLYLH